LELVSGQRARDAGLHYAKSVDAHFKTLWEAEAPKTIDAKDTDFWKEARSIVQSSVDEPADRDNVVEHRPSDSSQQSKQLMKLIQARQEGTLTDSEFHHAMKLLLLEWAEEEQNVPEVLSDQESLDSYRHQLDSTVLDTKNLDTSEE